jgi:hypothetical protein
MPNDQEAVQQFERQAGYSEEVECDDHLAMISEKCLPAMIVFARPRPQASQIPGDRPFGDAEPELLQLPVDLRCPPADILNFHLANEASKLFGDPRSTAPPSGSPTPIQSEASSMPRDDGRWFHDSQNIRPSRPHNP